MANYVCYPMTNVPDHLIAHVTAPVGGLTPGNVVVLTTLDANIAGNFTQFTATQPLTANLNTNRLAIVINGGFETMSNGRRPAGQPDYTQYTYPEGSTVPVLVLAPDVTFYLSDDCLAAPATAGQYLYGANASNAMSAGASRSATAVTNSVVLAKKSFRLGGKFASQFATGNVCRVTSEVVLA